MGSGQLHAPVGDVVVRVALAFRGLHLGVVGAAENPRDARRHQSAENPRQHAAGLFLLVRILVEGLPLLRLLQVELRPVQIGREGPVPVVLLQLGQDVVVQHPLAAVVGEHPVPVAVGDEGILPGLHAQQQEHAALSVPLAELVLLVGLLGVVVGGSVIVPVGHGVHGENVHAAAVLLRKPLRPLVQLRLLVLAQQFGGVRHREVSPRQGGQGHRRHDEQQQQGQGGQETYSSLHCVHLLTAVPAAAPAVPGRRRTRRKSPRPRRSFSPWRRAGRR